VGCFVRRDVRYDSCDTTHPAAAEHVKLPEVGDECDASRDEVLKRWLRIQPVADASQPVVERCVECEPPRVVRQRAWDAVPIIGAGDCSRRLRGEIADVDVRVCRGADAELGAAQFSRVNLATRPIARVARVDRQSTLDLVQRRDSRTPQRTIAHGRTAQNRPSVAPGHTKQTLILAIIKPRSCSNNPIVHDKGVLIQGQREG
jgi:hypothetical protein